MSKEIHEQPRALRDTLMGRLRADGSSEFDELSFTAAELSDIDRLCRRMRVGLLRLPEPAASPRALGAGAR